MASSIIILILGSLVSPVLATDPVDQVPATFNGTSISTRPSEDSTECHIRDISMTRKKHLLVPDYSRRVLQCFDLLGQLMWATPPGLLDRIRAAREIYENKFVLVSCLDRCHLKMLHRYENGEFELVDFATGLYITDTRGLAVDSEGYLHMLATYYDEEFDHRTAHTLVLNRYGELMDYWRIRISRIGHLTRIAVSPDDDKIYIISYNTLHGFRIDGQPLFQYGRDVSTLVPGPFEEATGISTDEQGRILLVDWAGHRIQMLTPDGQFLKYVATEEDGLHYPLAVTSVNDWAVVSEQQQCIIKFFKLDQAAKLDS